MFMGSGISEGSFRKYLKISEEHKYALTTFHFNNSFYCTTDFDSWWEEYFLTRLPNKDVVITRLEEGFARPIVEKPKKSKQGGNGLYPFLLCLLLSILSISFTKLTFYLSLIFS